MTKGKPDKVRLTIQSEERLSPDRVGVELAVKILDQTSEPVSGQPFQVHADGEVLLEGITNERGEFSGQRVLTVQEGTQRKVFLVLDGSAATDWKTVGEKKEEPQVPETMEVSVKVLDAAGKPLIGYPFKVQVENDGPVDAKTDGKGEYRRETILGAQQGTQRRVSLVLKVATVLPKEEAAPSDILNEVLSGKRAIKNGEEFRLAKETYKVTGDINVEEGGCLVIEAGAVLEFQTDTGILARGLLRAIGTKEAPIIFKASEKRWGNITLYGKGVRGSQLEYCVVENGGGRQLDTGKAETIPLPYTQSSSYRSGGGILILSTDEPLLGFNDEEVAARNLLDRVSLKDLLIRGCEAERGNGGGISCLQSSPIIENCRIDGNQSYKGKGGGIYIDRGNFSLKNTSLTSNKAEVGGGIYLDETESKVESTAITGNSAEQGGGVFVGGGNVRFTSSQIRSNTATECQESSSSGGGGVRAWCAQLHIDQTEVTGNKARCGGGISAKSSQVSIKDSKIKKNVADFEGGGIKVNFGKMTLLSSEVNGNSVRQKDSFRSDYHGKSLYPSGGGILVEGSDDPTQQKTEVEIGKTEISGNTSAFGGGIAIVHGSVKVSELTMDSNQAHQNGTEVHIKFGSLNASKSRFKCQNDEPTCIHIEGDGVLLTKDTTVRGGVRKRKSEGFGDVVMDRGRGRWLPDDGVWFETTKDNKKPWWST